MEKKNVIFLSVIAVATLLTAVIGTTFAYFTANFAVSNKDAVNTVKTKKLASTSVVIGERINSTAAYPGFKGAQSLTIDGNGAEGDVSAKAKITVAANIPEAFKTDVTWKLIEVPVATTITCKSSVQSTPDASGLQYSDNATCEGLTGSETVVLSSSTSSTTTIDVAYNTHKKYYLIVDYANKGNQDSQQAQTFTIQVSAEQVANS